VIVKPVIDNLSTTETVDNLATLKKACIEMPEKIDRLKPMLDTWNEFIRNVNRMRELQKAHHPLPNLVTLGNMMEIHELYCVETLVDNFLEGKA